MQTCADHAAHILGGTGYMRSSKRERIYREVKVMQIGGGANEIMKELAWRQLGLAEAGRGVTLAQPAVGATKTGSMAPWKKKVPPTSLVSPKCPPPAGANW